MGATPLRVTSSSWRESLRRPGTFSQNRRQSFRCANREFGQFRPVPANDQTDCGKDKRLRDRYDCDQADRELNRINS